MTRHRIGREAAVYVGSIALLQILYVVGAATAPNPFLGFNQLAPLGGAGTVLLLAAVWLAAVFFPEPASGPAAAALRTGAAPGGSVVGPVLFACGGALAFYLLRSNALNPDAAGLLEKIRADLPVQGAHVTHDEMLELYLHSRFYFYASQLLGWSIVQSYQALSIAAGSVFLFALFQLGRGLVPGAQPLFLSLMLCGGYVQLFFGHVENYSLVAATILLYLAAAHRCLEGRVAFWLPSVALSAAMGLHLLAGWLLPSWGYLLIRAWRRHGIREFWIGGSALVLPLVALLVFFHFHGLPIPRLFDSSHVSGMGGHYERYIAPLHIRYVGGIVNVMSLLTPGLFLLPGLIAFRRLGSDPYPRFLQVAGFSMLVFAFAWRAQLGFHQDWDLYAPGMVPVSLLIARSLCAARDLPRSRAILGALALTGGAHSAAWIVLNARS